MRTSKMLLKITVLALALGLLLGAPATAADKAKVLKEAAGKIEALIGGPEGQLMMQNVGMFKKAGLSHQKSLTVPLENLLTCKNSEDLRMLFGMYVFDSNYALAFGKRDEFGLLEQLIRNDLFMRLKLDGKIRMGAMTMDELKKVADDPENPANRELFAKRAMENLRAWVAKAGTDEEVTEFLVEASYGAVVEGIFVVCKLAEGAGPGDKLVPLFNEQAKRLDRVYQLLEAYAASKELSELLELDQRKPILKPIVSLITERKGKLAMADVKQILSVIEPHRAEIVKKCK